MQPKSYKAILSAAVDIAAIKKVDELARKQHTTRSAIVARLIEKAMKNER